MIVHRPRADVEPRYMGGEGEYSELEAEEDGVYGPYTGMLWGRCAGRAAMNVW